MTTTLRLFPLFAALALSHAQAAALRIDIDVRDTVLSNGLRVLVYQKPAIPAVACRLFYATGSMHEHPGVTGSAHMLEHMLFKGTRKVGTLDSTVDESFLVKLDRLDDSLRRARKHSDSASVAGLRARMDSLQAQYRKSFVKEELWQAYQEAGGTGLNAFTTDMATAYTVTLPSNRVEMFFWFEADRMVNAVMRDFHSERDVVREERRMRIENRPEGRYWETLQHMLWGAHPYGNPTIGWPEDIENYTRQAIEEHYRRWYGPANAVLVLAGDITADSAFRMAARYFGPIRKGAALPEVLARDPEPVGQKRFVDVQDNARPSLDLFFPTPDVHDSDVAALEILEGLLSGAAGRLEPRLVDSLRLATDAGAGNDVRPGAGSFQVSATPAQGADVRACEAEIWKVLADLRDSLVSDRELERVKNLVMATRLRRLRDMETLATDLGFMELYGDWRLVRSFPEAVMQVDANHVRDAARRWLRPERATVGTLLPRNHDAATRDGSVFLGAAK